MRVLESKSECAFKSEVRGVKRCHVNLRRLGGESLWSWCNAIPPGSGGATRQGQKGCCVTYGHVVKEMGARRRKRCTPSDEPNWIKGGECDPDLPRVPNAVSIKMMSGSKKRPDSLLLHMIRHSSPPAFLTPSLSLQHLSSILSLQLCFTFCLSLFLTGSINYNIRTIVYVWIPNIIVA